MSYIDDIYERIEVLDYQIDILNRNYSNLIRRNANYNDHLYYNPIYQNYYNNLSDPEDILSNILFERSRRNYDLLRNRNRNSTSTTNNYSQPLYSRNIFLNRNNTRQSNLNNPNTQNTSNNNPQTSNNTQSSNNNAQSSNNNPNTTNSNQSNSTENNQRHINENNTPNNSFNENFATNFAQRIHNIFRNVGNNEEINIIPNIQIETHTQIIVSHKSVSNNTKIEVFKKNESTENENESNENESNIDTESTQNQNQSNESTENETNIDNRCVICMENIQEGDIIRKLNKCNHFFHISCIDKWFESKITCPTCRQDIRNLPNVNVDLDNEQ